MKKSPHETESDVKAFGRFDWFGKLWNGSLFGGRKDELILRILKLGARDLLMSRCGLRLDRDTIDPASAPSMKLLLAVLREAESQWKKVEQAASKAQSVLDQANPEDYKIERTIITNVEGECCETEIWTPKHLSAKGRKQKNRNGAQ